MSKYVIGEVLGTNEVQELPVGSVVKKAKPNNSLVVGEFVRVKSEDGTWINAEDGEPTVFGQTSVYIVVFIPPEPTGAIDPVIPLASELRRVWWGEPVGSTDEVEWRRVAEHVLNEFVRKGEQPTRLIDSDGDTWTLRDDGLYDPPEDEDHLDPKTLIQVAQDYAIKGVIV